MVQTEFAFTLPYGYTDEQGVTQRQGVIRRATALDEIEAMGTARVRANEAYLPIALLSRVLLRLGTISPVGQQVVERLLAADFIYLQGLYARLNGGDDGLIETRCPTCGTQFMLDLYGIGDEA
jgi:hypothetical protein